MVTSHQLVRARTTRRHPTELTFNIGIDRIEPKQRWRRDESIYLGDIIDQIDDPTIFLARRVSQTSTDLPRRD
jgi:hypothetical protein